MKWRVTFRQRRTNCCPPGEYWVVRHSVIEAESRDHAQQMIREIWRNAGDIEIKEIIQGETS